ncbi:UDP-N-acetylglucosamine 1-carboxyvinyltransferase [Streptomyces cellostaticus]|uniref:UDP-N-acetylglucosamine 1-carboxyvinyltransferase n=1 Tax=Streptomyces cellostaticus TaxID=67285 RepID=UPI0020267D35|nr:UDP-N-acetylglucosamine 1-carboxyvinyltransferase [Streptomyces cellostaticus]
MESYPPIRIRGGHPLRGTAEIQGAKGCAVLLSAAAFVSDSPVTLTNMPHILDVDVAVHIAKELGHDARMIDHSFNFQPALMMQRPVISAELGQRLRVTPCLAAAILASEGEVQFPLPGGDAFCPRPIDKHLAAMEAAGATISTDESTITAQISGRRPVPFKFSAGTDNGPSLGATVTALLLASRAQGVSLITEPSPEPEVEHVLSFLSKCGIATKRRFDGAIEVAGSSGLHRATKKLPADRLEAGTLAIATVLTGGSVTLADFDRNDLPETFWSLLHEAGALINTGSVGCTIGVRDQVPDDDLRVRDIVTAPHPGFPTDLQPQATVLTTKMAGTTRIFEGVHARRSSHVDGLRQFGARISSAGRTITVTGPTTLKAADVAGEDIRCVVAFMLAALTADGWSTIHGGYHLQRGHGDLAATLRALGAEVHEDEMEACSGGK